MHENINEKATCASLWKGLCCLANASGACVDFASTRDASQGVPVDFVRKMLNAVGAMVTGKHKGVGLVFAAIKKMRIICGPGNTPLLCSQCLDPTHSLLIKALDGVEGAVFPPLEFRDDVTMRVLRQAGLRTLKNPEVFNLAATTAAERKDPHFSQELLRFLVNNWDEMRYSGTMKGRGLLQLKSIPFIPARSMDKCLLPSAALLGTPNFSASRQRESDFASRSRSKGSIKSHRGKGDAREIRHAQQAHDLLEDEMQGALDFGELEVDGNQSEAYLVRQQTDTLLHEATELAIRSEAMLASETAARETVTASPEAAAGAGAGAGAGGVQVVFVSFDGRDGVLAQDAWLCSADASILPSVMNAAPRSMIQALNVTSPPHVEQIARHVLYTTMNAKANQDTLAPSDWIRLRAVVLGGLALVQEAVGSKQSSASPAYSKRQAKVVLSPAYLIITDENDMMRPSEICADLDEDIDADLRAIPTFMEGLYSILTDIGARSTAAGATSLPKIKITDDPAAQHLGKQVATSLNNPTFADIKMVVHDPAHGTRPIFCHRLVLGLVSEYFRTMFTMSGMEEGRSQLTEEAAGGGGASVTTVNMTTLELPEFATYDGVMCMLRYLYTGAADGGDIKVFQPADAEKCALQWCEVYLGADEVLNLYNACDLVVLADMCSAPQLRKRCIYQLRSMLEVVVKMEEWEAVPDALQAEILPVARKEKSGGDGGEGRGSA
eukprot:gene4443-12878_t